MGGKGKRILIRADGNAEIGLGHLVRSLALVSTLVDTFQCILYTRFINQFLEEQARNIGIEIVKLEEDESHFTEFLKFVRGDDIVVLDNYFFSTDYQSSLKEIGCKLVCIDDLHDKEYLSDVVINHSPIVRKEDFKTANYTKLLLGFDYVLLRSGFLRGSKNVRREVLKEIMICFGGSDYQNLNLKTAKEIVDLDLGYTINVVISSAYKYGDELNTFAMNNKEVNIHTNLNEDEMIALIESQDLAIVPSSTVLFEIIALGKPFITGFYAENQMEISQYFSEIGSVVKGNFQESRIRKADIIEAYQNKDFSYLIDGNSPNRYLELFRNMAID